MGSFIGHHKLHKLLQEYKIREQKQEKSQISIKFNQKEALVRPTWPIQLRMPLSPLGSFVIFCLTQQWECSYIFT